jgi:hypothetical protein
VNEKEEWEEIDEHRISISSHSEFSMNMILLNGSNPYPTARELVLSIDIEQFQTVFPEKGDRRQCLITHQKVRLVKDLGEIVKLV